MSRTPTEIRKARMGPLSRLPAFFALDSKRAVVAGGGPPRHGKPNSSRPPAPGSMSSRRRPATTCTRLRRIRPPALIVVHRAVVDGGRFRRRRDRRRRMRRRRGSRAIRRRRPRRRRAGQRHRPAGLLRLLLRRDRQPLAARHRHLDRRRGAGFRPGDPRQDRGADPERVSRAGPTRRVRGVRALRRSRCRSAAAGMFWEKFTDRADRRARRVADATPTSSRCSRRPRRRKPVRSSSSAPAPAIRNC